MPRRPSVRLRHGMPRRRRERLEVELTDFKRVPLPNFVPREDGPAYLISPMGRVYRTDGRRMAINRYLQVNLDNSRTKRSVPLAVLRAFGHLPLTRIDTWWPWVDPDGPVDEVTGQLRCSIVDVRLTTLQELTRFSLGGPKPTTFYPTL